MFRNFTDNCIFNFRPVIGNFAGYSRHGVLHLKCFIVRKADFENFVVKSSVFDHMIVCIKH